MSQISTSFICGCKIKLCRLPCFQARFRIGEAFCLFKRLNPKNCTLVWAGKTLAAGLFNSLFNTSGTQEFYRKVAAVHKLLNNHFQAFGYHVSVGRHTANSTHRESTHQVPREGERLSVDVHSSAGSESAFPYTGHSEARDPFNFTPTTSPQLVQVIFYSHVYAIH